MHYHVPIYGFIISWNKFTYIDGLGVKLLSNQLDHRI